MDTKDQGKKINKKVWKTFEKNDRLDPIRLAPQRADRPLSLQTSLSIDRCLNYMNSNHAESMLSVICSILGVPRCPQSSQTEPRGVPKMFKMCQKVVLETWSSTETESMKK